MHISTKPFSLNSTRAERPPRAGSVQPYKAGQGPAGRPAAAANPRRNSSSLNSSEADTASNTVTMEGNRDMVFKPLCSHGCVGTSDITLVNASLPQKGRSREEGGVLL